MQPPGGQDSGGEHAVVSEDGEAATDDIVGEEASEEGEWEYVDEDVEEGTEEEEEEGVDEVGSQDDDEGLVVVTSGSESPEEVHEDQDQVGLCGEAVDPSDVAVDPVSSKEMGPSDLITHSTRMKRTRTVICVLCCQICCCCIFLVVCGAFWLLVIVDVIIARLSACDHDIPASPAALLEEFRTVQQLSLKTTSQHLSLGVPAAATVMDLQMKGSHNSYKDASGLLSPLIPSFGYSHPPLLRQLDVGVRAFEFDIHYVPELHRFSVYHGIVVDSATSCHCLQDCFLPIRRWSASHSHQLLFFNIEPKNQGELGTICSNEDFVSMLHEVILGIFPRDSILVPSDVIGGSLSVQEALNDTGWPSLNATRDKVLFYFNIYSDNEEMCRERYEKTKGEKLMFIRTAVDKDGSITPQAHASILEATDPKIIASLRARNLLVICHAHSSLGLARDCMDAGASIIATNVEEEFLLNGTRCNPKPKSVSDCVGLESYLHDLRTLVKSQG